MKLSCSIRSVVQLSPATCPFPSQLLARPFNKRVPAVPWV